jgi:hypothetical protein
MARRQCHSDLLLSAHSCRVFGLHPVFQWTLPSGRSSSPDTAAHVGCATRSRLHPPVSGCRRARHRGFGRCPSCGARDPRPRVRRAGGSWTTSGRRRWVGRFAKRDDDHVREEAAVAVGRVGDPNAMDDLVAALQEDRSQHVPRRRWACSATRARSSSRLRHGGPARRRCPGPSHARRGGGRRGPAGCGGVATERSPGR